MTAPGSPERARGLSVARRPGRWPSEAECGGVIEGGSRLRRGARPCVRPDLRFPVRTRRGGASTGRGRRKRVGSRVGTGHRPPGDPAPSTRNFSRWHRGEPRHDRPTRQAPGGERVGVFQADLASFDLPRRDYAVAVCAVSTLFMLPGPEPQLGCVKSAVRHLRPEGQLFIEAFRPDPDRFDADGRRIEHRPAIDGLAHTVRSVHLPEGQRIQITHELTDAAGQHQLHRRAALRHTRADRHDGGCRWAAADRPMA